jgi:fructose-1,6-bisphosphatase
MSHIGITINRHIVEQQRQFPEATGEFTGLLTQIALAAGVLSNTVLKLVVAVVVGRGSFRTASAGALAVMGAAIVVSLVLA